MRAMSYRKLKTTGLFVPYTRYSGGSGIVVLDYRAEQSKFESLKGDTKFCIMVFKFSKLQGFSCKTNK